MVPILGIIAILKEYDFVTPFLPQCIKMLARQVDAATFRQTSVPAPAGLAQEERLRLKTTQALKLYQQEMEDELRQCTAELRSRLEQPFSSINQVLECLYPPLIFLGLVKPLSNDTFNESLSIWTRLNKTLRARFVRNHLTHLQATLLDKILVDWGNQLETQNRIDALNSWFCPHSVQTITAVQVVRISYQTLSAQLSAGQHNDLPEAKLKYMLRIIGSLTKDYPINTIFESIFPSKSNSKVASTEWEAFIKLAVAIPARVSNAIGRLTEIRPKHGLTIPDGLEWRTYYALMASSFEIIVKKVSSDQIATVSEVLLKLSRNGFFPAELVSSGIISGFWQTVIPKTVSELTFEPDEVSKPYFQAWQKMLDLLPTPQLQTVILSLLTYFHSSPLFLGNSHGDALGENVFLSKNVKLAGYLLKLLLPTLGSEVHSYNRVWDVMVGNLLLKREGWDDLTARLMSVWLHDNTSESLTIFGWYLH